MTNLYGATFKDLRYITYKEREKSAVVTAFLTLVINENTKRKSTYFREGNQTTNDDSEIAEKFASNLAEIFGAPTLTQQANTPHIRPKPPEHHEISISLSELKEAINSGKSSAAPGPDQITNLMLKSCPPHILLVILSLFNASLKNGHLPTNWKHSKIIMIAKKNMPKDSFSSYRPISLISCLSKCLEKIINSKLISWAEQNSILPDCQAGFRKKNSCQDHILRLNQHITEGFNKQQITTCVMFDLEKAFDKASHAGILLKLNNYNLPLPLYNWIKDFLAKRSFHVTWNSANSKSHDILTGVPQGSCLSPTIFNIFFSDIAHVIDHPVNKALYADDLAIWFTGNKKKEMEQTLQKAIDHITSFCTKWGFKLNKCKTTYTVFTTAGKRSNYERTYQMKLFINNTQIPMEPHPLFLGIKLDPKLSYSEHLTHISHKIANRVNLIRKVKGLKLKNQVDINLIIYKSLIRSIIDYAFIPLISSTQRILNKVQTIQNNTLRTIKRFPLRSRTAEIHEVFKLERIETRAKKTARKYANSRLNHPLLTKEYEAYIKQKSSTTNRKWKTIFDSLQNLLFFFIFIYYFFPFSTYSYLNTGTCPLSYFAVLLLFFFNLIS